MKKEKGFTLVELLAVIVILAIILVIAVPQIMNVIDSAREGALISSAKLIASTAETRKATNDTLGIVEDIECDDVSKTTEDYEYCDIEFDTNGKAHVTIKGANKFKDKYICAGTRELAEVSYEDCTGIEGGASGDTDSSNPSISSDPWGRVIINVPVGATAILEKDETKYTTVAGDDGKAIFNGITTGTWLLTLTNGEKTTTPLPVDIVVTYEFNLDFFESYINVTYPANSACTATNGTTTLVDRNDTNDEKTGTFVVRNAGEWKVTCSNGTNSTTKTVEITTEGQTEDVTITYEFWLFKSGEGAKVQFQNNSASSAIVSIGTDYIGLGYSNANSGETAIGLPYKIDVSNYTKLNVSIICTNYHSSGSGGSYHPRFMIANNSPTSVLGNNGIEANLEVSTTGSNIQNLSLNISELEGEYYVSLWGLANAKVYNWWLEP